MFMYDANIGDEVYRPLILPNRFVVIFAFFICACEVGLHNTIFWNYLSVANDILTL